MSEKSCNCCVYLTENAPERQPIGQKANRFAEQDERADVTFIERERKQRGQ